jgi:hypothetical protein
MFSTKDMGIQFPRHQAIRAMMNHAKPAMMLRLVGSGQRKLFWVQHVHES